jgi:hypothetical protein
LVSIDGKVDSLSWSPDERKLLCTVQKTDEESLEREKNEYKNKLGIVARHYNRLFCAFPDEFHGLSRTGRTDRRIARLNYILQWFENYLK